MSTLYVNFVVTAMLWLSLVDTDEGTRQIVKIHVIFQGKSARSLPKKGDLAALRARYPKFKFAVSPNHW